MGKITHTPQSGVSEGEWSAEGTHLIGGITDIAGFGAYDYIVAGLDCSDQVKSCANVVCDGTNDEIQLLDSITQAGNTNKAIRWMGSFYLGANLEIPVLQNYLIDAQDVSIYGGAYHIIFDSFMNCRFDFNIITGGIELKPINDSEILGAGVCKYCIASRITILGLLGTATQPALTLDAARAETFIDFNHFDINEITNSTSLGTGVKVLNPAADGSIRFNTFDIKRIYSVDTGIQNGESSSDYIYGNYWKIGRMTINTGGNGILHYANNGTLETYEVALFTGTFTKFINNARLPRLKGQEFEKTGIANNVTLDGSGVGNIAHGCPFTPTYANVVCQSGNLNVRITNIDATNIVIIVYDLDNVVVTADTHDFYWEAK